MGGRSKLHKLFPNSSKREVALNAWPLNLIRTFSPNELVQPQILAEAGLDCKTIFDPSESDTKGKAEAPKYTLSNASAIKITKRMLSSSLLI